MKEGKDGDAGPSSRVEDGVATETGGGEERRERKTGWRRLSGKGGHERLPGRNQAQCGETEVGRGSRHGPQSWCPAGPGRVEGGGPGPWADPAGICSSVCRACLSLSLSFHACNLEEALPSPEGCLEAEKLRALVTGPTNAPGVPPFAVLLICVP